jgi:excisionase family DNA binding protein
MAAVHQAPRLLLDLPQVAEALSLSLRSVQGLIYAGKLASVTVGRSRRVAAADLADFVQMLRVQNKTVEAPSLAPTVQEDRIGRGSRSV